MAKSPAICIVDDAPLRTLFHRGCDWCGLGLQRAVLATANNIAPASANFPTKITRGSKAFIVYRVSKSGANSPPGSVAIGLE